MLFHYYHNYCGSNYSSICTAWKWDIIVNDKNFAKTRFQRMRFFLTKIKAMERVNYLFNVEAEHSDSVLIKILAAIVRRRIPLVSFSSQLKPNENLLCITFVIEETAEHTEKFFRQLEKQVDIISVTFFEHITEQCVSNRLPGIIHT
jgi:acetolactate synthase regulatory subunit